MTITASSKTVWTALLYAGTACLSLVLISALEALSVLRADGSIEVADWAELFASCTVLAGKTLAVSFVPLVASFVWKALQPAAGFAWRHATVDALFGFTVAAVVYLALHQYEPFRGYPPFVVGCVGLGLGLTAMLVLLSRTRSRPAEPRARALLRAGSVLCVSGAATLYWANYFFYAGLYYPLHLATMHATLALLAVGLLGLVTLLPLGVAGPPRRAGAVVFALGGCGLSFAVFAGDEMTSYARTLSVVGQTSLLLADEEPPVEAVREAVPESATPYLELFEEHHPFPPLPDPFHLQDYNVLLITIEAVRFDDTTLGKRTRKTTPHLARFAAQGYANTAAYSPSSGTLHSMAANLSLSYPSLTPVETWKKPWHGELDESATTIAETFQQAGRSTFWVGHNHNRGFGRVINGLDQGFEDIELLPDSSRKPVADIDARIARAAIDTLAEAGDSQERFFGWIFFASPHGPYLSHYPDRPDDTARDRYRQEIAYTDEQLGKVLEALRELDLWDDTIVVVTSDHGEEFRDHGGTRHKSSVYSEVVHVPFALRIPGMPPQTSDTPMSTLYVWPWLLLRGDSAQAARAARAIDEGIGPILDRTDGGVLAELLGHDRMKSTLVYPRLKVNYDFRSGFYELYDLDDDPLEQDNIVRSAPEAEEMKRRMAAYRAFRAEHERHSLAPDKSRK